MLRFADLLERESERLAGLGRFLLSFLSDFSFIAFGFDFVISFVGDEERLALRPFSVRF
jgi:hypothetical protein